MGNGADGFAASNPDMQSRDSKINLTAWNSRRVLYCGSETVGRVQCCNSARRDLSVEWWVTSILKWIRAYRHENTSKYGGLLLPETVTWVIKWYVVIAVVQLPDLVLQKLFYEKFPARVKVPAPF